jgi:hypothetical protein
LHCQQEAFALAGLLRKLGFDAWPVHSEHCDFPDIKDTGNAWVRVSYWGGTAANAFRYYRTGSDQSFAF